MNRVVTNEDLILYKNIVKEGDLIIDTPTKVWADGSKEVIYYFMHDQWPNLKDGLTIWFDGEKLGKLSSIKLCNTSDKTQSWGIDTATIRNIPGTRVVFQNFCCYGLKHFVLDGEVNCWKNSKFLSGSYGFRAIGKMNGGHGFEIFATDGGTIKMSGFEAQHGFSGLRINGDRIACALESVDIHDFYIHDTAEGEGQYIGSTKERPYTLFKNLHIYNGYLARTAAESLQVQHVCGNAHIHNVQIFAADVKWQNMFMAGQDTGIQWCVEGGSNNRICNVIVDGFAQTGMTLFGSVDSQYQGNSLVENVLFNDGGRFGMYFHKTMSYGVHWRFDNIHFRNFHNKYFEQTNIPAIDYIIPNKAGTDLIEWNFVTYDNSRKFFMQSKEDIAFKDSSGPIKYNNSGFHEPASNIKHWSEFLGGYFPSGKVRTFWKIGDICMYKQDDYFTFYKCINDHYSTGPDPNFENFMLLCWDENGIRIDQEGWRNTTKQYYFPPDDYRIIGKWKSFGVPYKEKIIDDFILNNERIVVTDFGTYKSKVYGIGESQGT